ncbi:MAG: hypothetical protein CFE23_12865 [Flavobacterium sp. BFFFF1]|uniref:ankyrin repeat domain-containing protein n=1 Tax=Flavobacterium sp. BFFFF1 TaxID=2015557 RepID=UPI000BCC225B|nr:ankyrin repeat domain-containing protein [Flavobacterium sp. BFFFF1]OYU79685.1 MAG: hypothetical protein CFE23_12865 [Flavobacterium sp. BFFFF1]
MRNLTLQLLFILFASTPMRSQPSTVFDVCRKGSLSEITAQYNQNPDIINSVNEGGSSPLILAAYNGNEAVALFLAEKVKDLNYNNGRGTALMAAVMNGNISIISKLLAQHANVDLTSADGKTALMYAVYFNKNEAAKLLIKSGADKTLKDNEGKTALDMAQFNKNTELIILLDQ